MKRKIKSVTDVITNSSTEVFMMKASELEDVLNKNPDLLSKKDLGNFIFLKTIDDIVKEFKLYPYSFVFEDLPEKSREILSVYKISEGTEKVLRDFGHTPEEIRRYESRINEEREKLRGSDKDIQGILDVAVGVWHDHRWGNLEKLKEYLGSNGIEYKYYGP